MIWRVVLAAFLTTTLSLFAFTAPRAQFNGCPAGFCSPAIFTPSAYAGPGDVVSGWFAWWGLRCFSNAYSGNVADVWDAATGSTTETLLTCSSGGVINQTIHALSVTCSVSCVVARLYDQTIGLHCGPAGGQSCDAIQQTNANRPLLIQNCPSAGLFCAQFANASNTFVDVGNTPSTNPVFSISHVSNRTSAAGSGNIIITNSSISALAYYPSSANTASCFGTSGLTATATDNTFHAIQCVINTVSSKINIDGSTTTGSVTGTDFFDGIIIGAQGSGSPTWGMNGDISEIGLKIAVFSSTEINNLHSNQSAYWGTP
jgi:hypothetical protein